MEYRKANREETIVARRMSAVAFRYNFDEGDAIKKADEDSNITWVAAEDGEVYSSLLALPFQMWFDGKRSKMVGVGAVTTSPQFRRGGHIRKLFKVMLEKAYDEGVAFSHLYPFSHEYYEQFGYEYMGYCHKYTLNTAGARKLKAESGTVKEYSKRKPDDSARKGIIACYETYASRHNLMLSRNDYKWNDVFDSDWDKNVRLFYCVNNGTVNAYVRLKHEQDGKVEVLDIAWLDHASMLGILTFMGNYEGAAGSFELSASEELVPHLFWRNRYEISTYTNHIGMNRIVNVLEALKLMNTPKQAGEIIIKVSDDFLTANDGCYKLSWNKNGSSAERTEQAPCLTVSQGALCVLMMGVYGFDKASERRDISYNCDVELLRSLFPKKPLLLTDFF